MTDLYTLNEMSVDKQTNTPIKHSYETNNNNVANVKLFIKAIHKALEKISSAEKLLSEIGDPQHTALERNDQQSEALANFASDLDLAGKIVDEFQKSTAIISHDLAELAGLFESIHETFTSARLMISMFAVLKDEKYAENAKTLLLNVLKMFESMKSSIEYVIPYPRC